uniref:Coiled-coil domain-containing protein 137 n=1 Tax=Caenorhabditis tropicalis TaxID=1561998 RepID=A0A1I7UQV5_9PELO
MEFQKKVGGMAIPLEKTVKIPKKSKARKKREKEEQMKKEIDEIDRINAKFEKDEKKEKKTRSCPRTMNHRHLQKNLLRTTLKKHRSSLRPSCGSIPP